jgi:hypothetical protein
VAQSFPMTYLVTASNNQMRVELKEMQRTTQSVQLRSS